MEQHYQGKKAGYEYLLAYKITVPIYDYTVEFCKRWIDYKSRTKDQMEQAARSGMQNISEGNKQQGLKGYIKLSGVARGSLEELLKDYLSYARQHQLPIWPKERCVREIGEIREIWKVIRENETLPDSPNFPSLPSSPDLAVNLMITLIKQANYLIDKLIISLKEKHMKEGGLTEELYKKRVEYRKNHSYAFTFIELVVVIALIAMLALVFIGLLNPMRQIQKSQDSKRKGEMATLFKAFEDFYNDKTRFPLPADVCFDSASSPRIDSYGKTACFCQICGAKSGSPTFSPYVPQLTCDPQSPQKEYLYDYDCSSTNPNWFRVYTKLSVTDDSDSKRVGCGAGCGPSPDFAYNYAVFSNTEPERISCTGKERLYYKSWQGNCNICKSPSGGDICNYSNSVYYDVSCTKKCDP